MSDVTLFNMYHVMSRQSKACARVLCIPGGAQLMIILAWAEVSPLSQGLQVVSPESIDG